MKNKKPLWITLIALDVAITLFLFVVSIIMLASTAGKTNAELEDPTTFIGFLQNNPPIYLGAFVVPLFVLLAANIIGLVIYVRKSSAKAPVKVSDLSSAQREALKAELLRDLTGKAEAKPTEEAKPVEEPKPVIVEKPTEEPAPAAIEKPAEEPVQKSEKPAETTQKEEIPAEETATPAEETPSEPKPEEEGQAQ